MSSLTSGNGPAVTVHFPPENLTRAPFELGCSPSPASITPAFTSSSLYFPISASSFSLGITPASVFLSALSRIMNRILITPLFLIVVVWGLLGVAVPTQLSHDKCGQTSRRGCAGNHHRSSCHAGGTHRLLLSLVVFIVVTDPGQECTVAASGWLLPVLLPTEWRQVEVVVRAGEQVRAARVGRVGVKHPVPLAQEDTQAMGFALGEIGLPLLHEFRLVPVVVLYRSDGLVQRDVEVVVEVTPERGVPRYRPAHAHLEQRDFGQRRTGHQHERGVASVQMREVPDVVDQEGAVWAALSPIRVEHKMVHDELTAPLEQVEQVRLAVRSLEDIRLVDLDHWQPAMFSVQRVPVTSEFLFLG